MYRENETPVYVAAWYLIQVQQLVLYYTWQVRCTDKLYSADTILN